MGGESVQLSQAQKRRMEAMSMNMGTRIVCGYLASLLFLGISLYLAVTYHTSGDLQSFWCYLALAAICLTLDVLETPGHSQGSVCLLVEGQRVIFAGDTLFRCSCGRCDFPGGDYRAMLRSLARLGRLEGQYTVYPGHDEATDMDYERKYNPYMKQGMNA